MTFVPQTFDLETFVPGHLISTQLKRNFVPKRTFVPQTFVPKRTFVARRTLVPQFFSSTFFFWFREQKSRDQKSGGTKVFQPKCGITNESLYGSWIVFVKME